MGVPQSDPDLPLVRALQAGDDSALNELIRKYQQPLFGFICRYTGDEETARDILQETFVRLYFGVRRFKPRAKFATWLYSIAMNLCRDDARSKQRRQSYATESLDVNDLHRRVPFADRAPDSDASSREQLAMLQKAIEELPHDLRTALLLFAVEGHSQWECAELLGISPKAVETRVYRARKILGKKIQQQDTE
ncbi:MAG: RNA polymerase sigma factor [Terrimicrobiaceae bacterium]|jgi:RNA polymerase sigma-70 factor (ECF subfamily)